MRENQHETIMRKVFQIQMAIKNPTKDTQGYGYKYATLEQVLDLIKPFLIQKNIMLNQFPYNEDARIGIKTILTCMETGEDFGFSFAIEISKKDPQGYGSAITYLRRYSLLSLFNLIQEDDDGRAAMQTEVETTLSEINSKLAMVGDPEYQKVVTDFVSKNKNLNQLNSVLAKVQSRLNNKEI